MNVEKSITARFGARQFEFLFGGCRPRILIVTDGQLNFRNDDEFGLWRFIESILGVPPWKRPKLTLGYRAGNHQPAQIEVGPNVFPVASNFKFDEADPAVTLRNFDQIWLFGNRTGSFDLTPGEVSVLGRFMNGGGGVFATGDHATIGRALCGNLPRIRHMRDWSSVPMGFESVDTAVERIDTIVSPGANALYEFDDQSDEIPQRIYPNYRVTGVPGNWEATIHPTLLLPGATVKRIDPGGFTKDIDVFPDHAHESVCFDVTDPATLAGDYTDSGQSFAEFQPAAIDAQQRVGAAIVAYAVSGGRAIVRFGTKPPVRPRMFGVLSAYDGRKAKPYSGAQPPGRILCDSTWHHYVNINLDGTGTSNPVRTGLGVGSGDNFVPNAALEKIFTFYRNAIKWLQPANRSWCPIIINLVAVRYSPQLIEELSEPEKFTQWDPLVALGRAAAGLIADDEGGQAVSDWIAGVLRSEDKTRDAGNVLDEQLVGDDRDDLLHGVVGGLLVKVATMLPNDDGAASEKTLSKGLEKLVAELQPELPRLLAAGAAARIERARRTLATFEVFRPQ